MSPPVPPAIVASGLNKSFEGHSAVSDLSFAVSPGEIFGLVGPDGCGKTTIMRMLAGVMQPDKGAITIDAVDVIAKPDIAKEHLSYMPQRFGLYEDMTVDENIRFYADLFSIPRATRKERAKRLLEASGMTAFRGRLAGQLSGGMKQKLGLTCSLIHTPKILLLDEPTTGVDPVSRRDFWRILYELRESGVTIVISTAYLDEAERCHRLALLNNGRLLHCDTPAALKARMTEALLSITTTDPRSVQDSVHAAAGVMSTMLMGDAVHVVVDDAGRRIAELNTALQHAGIAFDDIAEIPPTIEDLFLTLDDAGH